jgi:hypothetical protein
LPQVRAVALRCLAQLAGWRYDLLGAHMDAIFALTTQAIELPARGHPERDDEEVLAAIDFWASLSDCEITLGELAADPHTEPASDGKRPGQGPALANYAPRALSQLAPLLCAHLSRQSAEVDDDSWSLGYRVRNVRLYAGSCVLLGARARLRASASRNSAKPAAARSTIFFWLPLHSSPLPARVAHSVGPQACAALLPFVSTHVDASSWRLRDAAVKAFGCLLECPAREELISTVRGSPPLSLPHRLRCLYPIASAVFTPIVSAVFTPSSPCPRTEHADDANTWHTLHVEKWHRTLCACSIASYEDNNDVGRWSAVCRACCRPPPTAILW